ncbi:hypothetical protein [Aestuariivirga litoralis]|uniref:hypothetical protein n=1 Tax=Aestuariivirga litoralis TaxID=2650924 RepID=UPI0018C48ABB|nr:hypothetical protein [Aestuariivirga litoralis]MBG1233909.1 hypothetical protein [Aestuariivirga litoralis]
MPSAATPAHMPLPRLAINIGISGHRPNKLDKAGHNLVAQKFSDLAAMIDAEVRTITKGDEGRFYDGAAPLIRMVTGLAEGSDRLVLAHMPESWQFEAVLPLPREDYAKDFKGAARTEFTALLKKAVSVTELSSGGRERNESYAAQGEFLIRQVDLLVAIWDGKQADGKGGTGEIVSKALDAGVAVIWINPKPGEAPQLLSRVDGAHKGVALGQAELRNVLHHILAAPSHHAPAGHDEHHAPATPSPTSFLSKSWPSALYLPFAYTLLRALSGAGKFALPVRYSSLAELLGSWSPFFNAVKPADNQLSKDLTSGLLPRSIWADALAWYYGQLYRSAYVSIFILASISVPIGLCYLFFLSSPEVLSIKAAFVVIELLIISTVIIVVRRGVRANWHGAWLQTRKLSELLRLGRNLAYVGSSRSFVLPPGPHENEDLANWYVRATFRETGLPHAVLGADYLKIVLSGVNETEIIQQRAYHKFNAANLHKIHHFLHRGGDLCFMATIGFLLFYLAIWGIDSIPFISAAMAETHEAAGEAHAEGGLIHEALEYVIKPIVSIAAAGLPAMGAGLTGIREQGDFEGFAARSSATYQQLSGIETRISKALQEPERLDLSKAQSILLAATEVMAKDVTAWHQQFSAKRLSLPA